MRIGDDKGNGLLFVAAGVHTLASVFYMYVFFSWRTYDCRE